MALGLETKGATTLGLVSSHNLCFFETEVETINESDFLFPEVLVLASKELSEVQMLVFASTFGALSYQLSKGLEQETGYLNEFLWNLQLEFAKENHY